MYDQRSILILIINWNATLCLLTGDCIHLKGGERFIHFLSVTEMSLCSEDGVSRLRGWMPFPTMETHLFPIEIL